MKKISTTVVGAEQNEREDPPVGWELCSLKDISSLVTSGSRDWSKFYSDQGAFFIRSAEISGYSLRLSEAIHVALPAKVEGKRSLVEKGDILITITGANVGKCAKVDSDIPEAYVSQSVALIKLKRADLAPFVYYALRALNGAGAQLGAMAYGVGRPVLSLPQIKSLRIPLAPAAEQDRILPRVEGLLARTVGACDRLTKVPRILKVFRQSVLAAACSGRLTEDWRDKHLDVTAVEHPIKEIRIFRLASARGKQIVEPRQIDRGSGDLDDLPDTWSWLHFGSIIGELRNGISTRPEHQPPGHRILRISSVRSGAVSLGDVRYLPNSNHLADTYRLVDGDLLFTRYNGSLDLLGVCGMVTDVGKSVVLYPDKLMRVRIDHPYLLPSYTEIFFQAPTARDRMTAKAKSSAGQQGISGTDVKTQPIALPPLEEQREIVRRVRALFKLASKIEERVSTATKQAEMLTQAILAKAFRGELVPTEAEVARAEGRTYEPASALLERIKSRSERIAISYLKGVSGRHNKTAAQPGVDDNRVRSKADLRLWR